MANYDNRVPPQPYPPQPYPLYPYPPPGPRRPSILIWLIIPLVIGALGVVAAIVIPAFIVYGPSSSSNNAGQNGSSTSGSANALYQPVDGVTCDSLEHLDYHIHIHISIYINGQSLSIPQSIGIASDQSCYYWLHTHDTSGVIHVETPSNQKYTLGNFLDIWKSHFADLGAGFPSQLSQSGWTVFVNGQSSHNDLSTVQLTSHELITLAYNSPGIQPDTVYNWSNL